ARAETLRWWVRWGPLFVFIGLSALGVLGALLALWWRADRARRELEVAWTAQMERLERAQERLATLNLDVDLRDRVVALKIKGRRTREVADEVVDRLSSLHDGL